MLRIGSRRCNSHLGWIALVARSSKGFADRSLSEGTTIERRPVRLDFEDAGNEGMPSGIAGR